MNQAQYKKYKKKWEGVKKEIFLALQDENTEKAFEELDKVKDDPEFKIIPVPPDTEMVYPDSPLNELLVLLAHKKIFFTVPKKTEKEIEDIKSTCENFTSEQKEIIEKIENAINEQKSEMLKNNEDWKIENGLLLDDEGKRIYVNIPNAIPHFPVERMHAIPFIEKLIELGADPLKNVSNKGVFYKKLITVDSEQAMQYILNKLPDEILFAIDTQGGDYLCQTLQSRASKCFDVFVKEKENVIDFKKEYSLMSSQNLLHLAMGNYLPNEADYLISKGTPLTQRGYQGSLPADVIPNRTIAVALESDKNVIREDNEVLKSSAFNMFIPKDFKPHKAIRNPEDVDIYYEEMAGLTKACLKKERELSAQVVKKYRTVF